MKLDDLIVPTAVAKPGTKVQDVFRECVVRQVPGIPFKDASGRIIGKASIRHVLKMNCIPDYMVRHAALLGNTLTGLGIQAEKARRMLDHAVDSFVLADMATIVPNAPIEKALAVMERHDTTYLFVIDGDEYFGCVSIMGIAEAVMRYAEG
ncbi:CBS domain-containing protein [Thiohalocapsa marina]|uniref:CBS domain-containing protein n=1 Tax=Thiohalocapsa marina TaxID=424902 RepID=A0A5M8FBE7_9GAMM|nr:CBS domain-containing protein [Thiohalocapsa marina]KAA6182027.1 CBS domain-containing protein [Thiohalocapsa marina]